MEYFCVRCKKKHNVEDIAVDAWELFGADIAGNIQNNSYISSTLENTPEFRELLTEIYPNDEDKAKPFLDEIQKYLTTNNNKTILTKTFAIRGSDILQRAETRDLKVNSVFSVSFCTLLDLYFKSLVDVSDDVQRKFNKAMQIMTNLRNADEARTNVFTAKVEYIFKEVREFHNNTARSTLVYMMAKNDNNIPFEDKDNMRTAYARCCPHCGYSLSRAVGSASEIVIALEGCPRAGKTSGMIATISALSADTYRGFGMAPLDNRNKADKALMDQIETFRRGDKVIKTEISTGDPPVTSIVVNIGNKRERVVTFVDMAGELWQDENNVFLPGKFHGEYMPLIRNCDCLWFTVSKLSLYDQKTQNKIPNMKRDTADEAVNLANATARMLAAKLGEISSDLETDNEQMPPVAVIISKPEFVTEDKDGQLAQDVEHELKMISDYELFKPSGDPTNSQPLDYSYDEPLLEEKNFFAKSSKVKKYIKEENGNYLTAFEHCPRKFYISAASYGHYAGVIKDEEGNELFPLIPPTPYHELYPLLWTLAISGALGIKHPCVLTTCNLLGNVIEASAEDKKVRFSQRHGVICDDVNSKAELESLWYDVGANLFMANTDSSVQSTSFKKTEVFSRSKRK